MATRSTAARLRRTFRYPSDDLAGANFDSDSDSSPEAMDEQEQESYIQRLSDRNRAQNAQMVTLLLALPLLAAVPYLLALPSLPACLALSSLGATAYLLRRLPPAVTGLYPVDAWVGTGGAAGARGPLDQNLPYLNALLAILLAFWGAAVAYKTSRFDGGKGAVVPGKDVTGALAWPVMCNLPAGVYGVVLLAKIVMAGVDPERELSGLRYDYKGA
ncbi:hypothetical protein IF1G_09770 [Cordyceps javanica]|uniref:Uncharacterized protein n=1 Tax=Cordyceps javanica TaxID=43265 RepID=A0A545UQF4_9HYPO|nr:hypothetical protein IF1G_09770 [Cordyceps javanica]TQW03520.1 hypothetical protein IF2G_08818 [Cordyceps javanica]